MLYDCCSGRFDYTIGRLLTIVGCLEHTEIVVTVAKTDDTL
jgi:hypothetical protein